MAGGRTTARPSALDFVYYDFGRVHQTLRVTPAMEAGVTDHVWSVEEIVAVDETTARGDNMKTVTRSGWIFVGAVLGALATSWISPTMSAQNDRTRLQVTNDRTRLRITLASASIAEAAFIKDTKSNGCWFVVANAGVAMAPAEACQ